MFIEGYSHTLLLRLWGVNRILYMNRKFAEE